MLIQCTKSLLHKINIAGDELKTPEGHDYLPNSLHAWHANIVNINRRKAIVLMNNETRYPVVIYRPKSKDYAKIKELIKDAIRKALRMEGISENIISSYMVDAGEIVFSKTANRSMITKMNNTVRDIAFMQEYLDENNLIQRYISIATGRFIQNSSDDKYFYPIEKMIECLGIYFGGEHYNKENVLQVNKYQLMVQINIEGFDIWRRILVPSTFSFRHLHNVIQTVFDWQNYHLHVFEAKKTNTKDKQIVMDDDPETLGWIDTNHYDILQERFTALEDVLPEYGIVEYEYDFGDSWIHTITLEEVIKSNTFRATYIEGNGERPPEDVGGSCGYIEYMHIMKDKTNPQYESMKIWSESQKERKRSADKINDRLKHSFSKYIYYHGS